MGLLKFLFWAVLVMLLLRVLARLFLPILARLAIKKATERFTQPQPPPGPKVYEAGDVSIHKTSTSPRDGEFTDYEEVK